MEEEQLLEANEAVKYLAKRWGIESYSLEAFRMHRFRHHIKPALASKTSSFWRISDLDKIPKPDRNAKRGPRTKKKPDDGEDGEGIFSKVLLTKTLQPSLNTLQPSVEQRLIA